MLALKNHYYLKPGGEHRKKGDKENLKRVFYRNKMTLSFYK